MTMRDTTNGRTGFLGWLLNLFGVRDRRLAYPPPQPQPSWREPEPDYDSEVTLPLPSRDEYLNFTVRLRLHVRTDGSVPKDSNAIRMGLAGIRHRAQLISQKHSLLQADQLHADLELALSGLAQINGSGVACRASCQSVTVNEHDAAVLSQYESAMRTRGLARLSTMVEDYQIGYYSGLLTDPQRATAWWFHRNSSDVEKLPVVAETFKGVCGQLRGTETSEDDAMSTDSAGAVIDAVLDETNAPGTLVLDRFITKYLRDHQREDLLDRWRRLFTPETGHPEPEPGPPAA